jgi:hypothetical protein
MNSGGKTEERVSDIILLEELITIAGSEKVATSLMPMHSRPVTRKTRNAAQGSTTTSSHGISWRAKIQGRLSDPPKNKA